MMNSDLHWCDSWIMKAQTKILLLLPINGRLQKIAKNVPMLLCFGTVYLWWYLS